MPSSRSIDNTAGAADDIQAIFYYTLANWGPDQSDRFINDLSAFFDRLAAFPEVGKRRERLLPGARSYPFGSYVVIYTVEPPFIQIARVIRSRMDVEAQFESGE